MANKKKKAVKSTLPTKPSPVEPIVSKTTNKPYYWYVVVACVVLALTTLLWTVLGAKVMQNNADQLINSYLFDTNSTFTKSLFPGQHTYLLKWPLFFAMHLFGNTNLVYIIFTCISISATLGLFVYLLYKIDKRPLVFGTLVLMLASVLMLIPSQPYPGGLLPVNMAMVATRNFEYILFIACIYGAVNCRIRSKSFLAAVLALVLLIASDKLFLSLAFGGGFIGCVAYAIRKQRKSLSATANWLIAAVIGGTGGILLLWVINVLHITQISTQSSGPYSLTTQPHPLMLGLLYGFTSLFTNLGANPAYDTTLFRAMPHSAVKHILSFGGLGLIVNFGVLIIGTVAMVRMLVKSLGFHKQDTAIQDKHYHVSNILTLTTIVALVAFVVTNHYYAADARYLSIYLFALFLSLAAYVRTKVWPDKILIRTGIIVTVGIVLSVPMVINSYRVNRQATSETDRRNALVLQALKNHPVSYLIGDYWRVVPIRHQSDSTQNITPLSGCTQIRDVLSSSKWNPLKQETSFAYLLTLDKGLTDFPACTINAATSEYGRPNSSAIISGSFDKPNEMLLFYDYGVKRNTPQRFLKNTSANIAPIKLVELPNVECSEKSILNIVAHEDDDLLFINPDTQNDINAGSCVRTVYLTAGDAGSDQFYWLGREKGSEAAYNTMLKKDNIWIQHIVKLQGSQYITVTNPKGNTKVSIIFFGLPDGNIFGQGFKASNFESLRKLYSGEIASMHSVYGESNYSKQAVIDALYNIMNIYKPTEIRTQTDNFANLKGSDHSDHVATSYLTTTAYQQYINERMGKALEGSVTIKHYIGYPGAQLPENVSGNDLAAKVSTFLSYSKFDGAVCHTSIDCQHTVYGRYLPRQYVSQ